jgi:hypothetical protein
MPYLTPYPKSLQATGNSCWAAAARSICNWYPLIGKPGPTFDSDQAFADAWAVATGRPIHKDLEKQQSASAALADLRHPNNTDSAAIPSPGEIADAMNLGMPLLAIVAPTEPNPSPNLRAQDGHWVVIVGIDDAGQNLAVYDPAHDENDHVRSVSYDPKVYYTSVGLKDPVTLYWQNTSYVDEYTVGITVLPSPVPGRASRPAPPPGPAPAPTPAFAPPPEHATTPAHAPPPNPEYTWRGTARGGIEFQVGWTPLGKDGAAASLVVHQKTGPAPGWSSPQTVKAGVGSANRAYFPLGAGPTRMDLTLSLIVASAPAPVLEPLLPPAQAHPPAVLPPAALLPATPPLPVHLWADYPLSDDAARHRHIGTWTLGAQPPWPAPPPPPPPPPAPAPAPAPAPEPAPAPAPAPTPAPASKRAHTPAPRPASPRSSPASPAPRPAPAPAKTGPRRKRP